MKYLFNLGCGPKANDRLPPLFDDWQVVRVDIDERVSPDLVADLSDLSPIGSNIADAVWASHCIEHLYAPDIDRALKEIHRILRDDGFAVILVPDLQAVAKFIAEDKLNAVVYRSAAGPVTAHDMVYGFGPALAKGDMHMAHRSGFTPSVLMERFRDAGFTAYGVVRRPGLELVGIAAKQPWTSEPERLELFKRLGL